MTYASASASSRRSTNAAAGVSKPSPVFRRRNRDARSTPGQLARQESQNLVERRPEGREIKAFHEMFVASRPRFVAMANSILRNREDAEDAVQNAFLSGYLHLRSFEGRSALTTWFTRIVLNAALMIRRKRKPSSTWPLPESSNSDDAKRIHSILVSQHDPETVCAEGETLQFISGALRKMKPVLRQAFTMAYFDEMSGPEASALLGVSTGTFKARLFRARRQLLSHVHRSLVGTTRRTAPSTFLTDNNALQSLLGRPSDTPSLEAGLS